jgi:hypothetical protein
MAVAALAAIVAGCGSSDGQHSGASARPSAAGPSQRTCPHSQLTCEQLVALGLTYPYPRQPGSYLYVNGVAYPYVRLGGRAFGDAMVRAGGDVLTARALLHRLGLGGELEKPRTPVIAYGSNANVAALTRKFVTSSFVGPAVLPVIKGDLHDFDVTWSPDLVFNGAMPATITPSPGTVVSVWITWLDHAELAQMNATEGVGTLYSFGFLRHVRLDAPGPPSPRPSIYVGCFGALRIGDRILAIRAIPARRRRFAAANSPGAMARIAPKLGWRGSVFDLLLDNVRSPARRARRSKTIERFGTSRANPRYTPVKACRKR